MSKHHFDIINSPEAETFLRMVTKGFYENSYTGLWMYETIGQEWDEMRKWAEGLKDEINPQTCTWSIGIWEWVYGIETDEALQLEYRRQRILAKILGTKPINPEAIRRGVAKITGCDVDITDFVRPYCFALKVHMQEDGDDLPYESVREYIRKVKPSHLAAFLTWMFLVVIDSTQLEQFLHPWVQMYWGIPFWGCYIFDGTYLLDGSILLNSRRKYDLILWIKNGIKVYVKEAMNTDKLYINIPSCFNTYEKICDAKVLFRLGDFSFWKCAVLNGTRLFDGSVLLNSRKRYDLILEIKNDIKFHIKEFIHTACLNIRGKVYIEEKIDVVLAAKAVINFLHGCHQTADSAGTVIKIRHIAVVKTTGTTENITITYKRNLNYFDGSKKLDGSILINAFYGKEEI